MRLNLELGTGEVVRVFGPARLTVLRGRVVILGAVFSSNESIEINEYRSYAVKALEDSLVELRLSGGGSIEAPIEGEEVLDEWMRIADEIVTSGGVQVAFVMGPTDAGKSSFTAMLLNRALHSGVKPGVIDADIGQADVGPPGFVSATLVDRKILWLRWLRAAKMRFVGSVSPYRLERRVISAAVDLKYWLLGEGAQLVAVDTDGWVYGAQAMEYKLEMVKALRPTAIVVLGDEEIYKSVGRVLKGFSSKLYYLPTPAVVRTRDREDRRILRSEGYKRFFENAVKRKVKLEEVSVLGSCLYSGNPLPPERLEEMSRLLGTRVIAGSETPENLVLVVEGQPRHDMLERLSRERHVYVIQRGEERGLYIAVLGPDMEEKAPGVILSVDYEAREAEILTSYTGDIGGLIIGSLKLNVDAGFEEAGRIQRCPL